MLTCGCLWWGQDEAGLKHRPRGWGLLHLACATGQADSAALLIKHGVDVQGVLPVDSAFQRTCDVQTAYKFNRYSLVAMKWNLTIKKMNQNIVMTSQQCILQYLPCTMHILLVIVNAARG